MKRRDFLGACITGLGAAFLDSKSVPAARRGGMDRIKYGAQLYTARKLMAEDVPGTLAAIAALGYTEFEFAGYFGEKPVEIRKMLDGLGASAPSAHLSAEAFMRDFPRALDAASAIGHRYLVLPWWAEADRSLEGYKRLTELLNRSAEAASGHGIKVAYHNHDFEFADVGGVVPFDLLLAETQSNLVCFELDLYWCAVMSCSPRSLFEAHPGRFPLLHLKDRDSRGNMTDVGAGELDFAAILAHSALAGVEHAYVERDDTDSPLATFRSSIAHLASL